MTKSLWTTLTSSIFNPKAERSAKEEKLVNGCLSAKLNVDEEYQQAFRTNSYIEMATADTSSWSSSSSSLPYSPSPCLLQPDQQLLDDVIRSSHVHRLLIDYFHATLVAFKTCQLLLQALNQTRSNHAIINLTARALMADDDHDNQRYDDGVVFRDLSSLSHLKTPFSIISHTQFRALHDTLSELLQKLTHKRNETRRKLRLKRVWKKAFGVCIVASNAVVLIVLLVLALHSLVGVVAAPGLVGCFVGLLKRRDRKLASPELVCRQMEIAAKAAYIMMTDFDTLSRMAARLDGEVEHLRAIAEMWSRSRRCEIWKKAVREFAAQDDAIVEQMMELQRHIYLCFLTINRARRLVMQEIVGGRH